MIGSSFMVRRRLALVLVCVGLIVASAGAALWVASGLSRADAATPSLTVALTPANAARLVAATSAGATQVRAVGEQAKIINAALPFSATPIQAARPFAVADTLDHQRALLCLTQAVYYEAGFEPPAGRRAVAQVVLNRMRHPAFPKSVCGVVYQGARSPVCQFSFVCDGSLNRAPAPVAWNDARRVAEAALEGYVEPSVGSATHYHADYVAPRWAPMLTKITKLGAHIFYRWPGAWGQRAAFTGAYAGEAFDPSGFRTIVRAKLDSAETPLPTVEAGPPVVRAVNDVGGLLDTTKGWTLHIPGPNEVSNASSRALAQQSSAAPQVKASVAVATTAAPILASQ
ncbi:MAG: cell wall hydrolase [Sphingomicrobium sp.]